VAGQPWDAKELNHLRKLTQNGGTYHEITKAHRAAGYTRTRAAVRLQIQAQRALGPDAWHPQVPISPVALDDPITVQGDALCLFDLHMPYHDAKWINRVVGLAQNWGIDQLVLGGDAWDANALSPFGPQAGPPGDDELESAEETMDQLGRCFGHTVYFAGNHELRPSRALQRRIGVKWFMRLFAPADDFELSDYQWCRLVSGGETYMLDHPRNSSKHATLVAKDLVANWRCHVVTGHMHRWGMTRDTSGLNWAIDAGVCADEGRMAYVTKVHTRHPRWYLGAVLIVDGTPILLGPDNIGLYERMGACRTK